MGTLPLWILAWCSQVTPVGPIVFLCAGANIYIAAMESWRALPGVRERSAAGGVACSLALLMTAGVLYLGPGYRTPFRMEWWALTEGVAISAGLCLAASGYCVLTGLARSETWRVTLLWIYWASDLAVNIADRELWKPHRSPAEGLADQAMSRWLASVNHWEHAVVVLVWIWVNERSDHVIRGK